MMTLLFSQCPDAIHKAERFAEITKLIGSLQMMRINHLPIGNLRRQRLNLTGGQRRDASATRYALAFS
jgi:hypothetical protein